MWRSMQCIGITTHKAMVARSLSKKITVWNDVPTLKGHEVGIVDGSDDRIWKGMYLYIVTVICFAVLIIGAINLQVVQGRTNASRSQRNRIEELEVHADRGILYDRNGEKLVVNIPSYNIVIKPSDIEEDHLERVFTMIGGLLDVEPDELMARYDEVISIDPFSKRVPLVSDITRDDVLFIRSHSDELDGVEIEYASKRNYTGGSMFSHIIGYTGDASPNQIEHNTGLSLGDTVGKDGIELYYDARLRGTDGVIIVETDVAKNVITEYVNDGNAPISGESVYLTIDARVQRKLHELLMKGMEDYSAMGAAAIVEDVHTGEIRGMVSVPT